MADQLGTFRQFDQAWDFSCQTERRTYYVICSAPRSGGHYLGHLMYATGAMGYPLEYFLPDHFGKWTELSGCTAASEVIEYIQSRRTSPNGCFGLKVHFPEFARAVCEYQFDETFPQCRFLSMEREDILGQAISLVRARQTNQWISMHESQGETTYDFEAIEKAMIDLLEEKACWMRFFALTGREYLRVSYESLIEDPGAVIEEVARYLNLGPVQIRFDRVLPKKQAGAESERWRHRFQNDAITLPVEYRCRSLNLRLP